MVNKNNHVDELLKKYVNGEAIEETVDAFGRKWWNPFIKQRMSVDMIH
jgi:hypothetical protein